jgi:hypothetical protein
MLRMRVSLVVICVCLGVAACDPGRLYSIPGAKIIRADGVAYVAIIADGVEARFQARIFSVRGWTEVQVVNNAAEPIEFHPAATVIVGANAARIPAECQLPPGPVLLAQGKAVTIRCGFEARVQRFSYEPQFETLTLFQPGFSRGGKALPVVASMRGS